MSTSELNHTDPKDPAIPCSRQAFSHHIGQQNRTFAHQQGTDTRSGILLGLTSILVLYYELTAIRYLTTEVPVVSFFKNLILISCFIGFGVGLNLSLSKAKALYGFVLSCFLPTFLVWLLSQLDLTDLAYSGISDEAVLLWKHSTLKGVVVLFASFLSTMVPLIFLGILVGRYFDLHKKALHAYGWNIAGSLIGTLTFSFLCYFSLGPRVWFLCSALLFATIVVLETYRSLGVRRLLGLSALGFLPLIFLGGGNKTTIIGLRITR